MRKKSITLLAVLLILPFMFSLHSCDPYDDCGDLGGKYLIEKLEIRLLETINLDQERPDYIELATNSTINFTKLAISIYAESKRSAMNEKREKGFGFSSAYACSPAFIPTDSIQSIEIHSSGYAENDDITSKMIVKGGSFEGTIHEYLALNPLFPNELIFYPEVPPIASGEYSFRVQIILSGGELEEVQLTTETVNLELSDSN